MIRKLNDARIALGWGITFLGYGLWLAFDWWRSQKKIKSETIARLVANDARGRASEMRRHEMMLPREDVEIEP